MSQFVYLFTCQRISGLLLVFGNYLLYLGPSSVRTERGKKSDGFLPPSGITDLPTGEEVSPSVEFWAVAASC